MEKRFVIGVAANAFKGSLSAVEATEAIAAGFEQSRFACGVRRLPLADGGDGTLEVMLSQVGSQRQTVTVQNPLGEAIRADYGFLADGGTAVIELALASGLALLGERRDALHASTYGTGELMRHAIEAGAKRIILGVGGSATVDGGAGCLQALGVQLLNSEGQPMRGGGGALDKLARVVPNPRLDKTEILILCDVDNPPLGEHGAAAVFAPQKGASPDEVVWLENNLAHFFRVIAEQTGKDVRSLAGGGAAGAIAGGLAALAGAKLVPGAETLIQFLGYEQLIAGCDLMVTGEGKLDSQTRHGKSPAVIAAKAAAQGIPTIAIAGSVPSPHELGGIHAAFSLVPAPTTLDEAMLHAADWLSQTAHNIGNLLSIQAIR